MQLPCMRVCSLNICSMHALKLNSTRESNFIEGAVNTQSNINK